MKRLRRRLYPIGLGPAEAWAKTLSEAECELWAKRLGSLVYRMLPKKRAVATHHLLYAFGQTLDVKQAQQIIVETFQNLFRNAFECVRIASMNKNRFLEGVEVHGWEHIEAARRSGRGGILIGGHIGNWELAAAYMALRGLPIQVVARRIYLVPLDQKLAEMRERMGVKTLYRDGSMRPMLTCLKNNGFLGILPDQDVKRVKGMFVDFFGHPAYTPVGPALLAIASGSPILITRHVRKGNGHLIATDPPIYANREAPRDEEVNRLVTLYTQRLEQFIREYPSQWVWTHRRWRTQPPAPENT